MLSAERMHRAMERARPAMAMLTLSEQGLFLRCLLFATPDGWGSSEWSRMSSYALSMTRSELRPILIHFAKLRLIRIYPMPEEAKLTYLGQDRHFDIDSNRNLPKWLTPKQNSAWNPTTGGRTPRKFLWRVNCT